jgi:hypothetical protein
VVKVRMNLNPKPRVLFFRMTRQGLPAFIRLHLQEQVRCLEQFFDVTVIDGFCDYGRLCDEHQPELSIFESGVYVGPRVIINTSAHPQIPKLGFCHCDAYCETREVFIADMAAWGVEDFFTLSVSLASYTPALADQMFVWPNFVEPKIFHDYGLPKVIPVLITGSQATHYPWRNAVNQIAAQHYPTLQSPHFGWFNAQKTTRMHSGESYARLINAALVAPTCGTIANEIVRKHFEIPACNTCLITQRTHALEAAGFLDLVNCVFVEETEALDKLDWIFQNPEECQRISRAGHELVHARHTIQARDQIYQWFLLKKQLKPYQRIVQPGPFLPLTIVNRDSGIRNGHIKCGALDRMLLAKGDEHLWAGRYDEAEKFYYQCLNYHKMPEPKLRLAWCSLYQGKAEAGIRWLWEQIQGVHVGFANAEPDPVEWAYYIVALLCLGKTSEAVIRAGQFKSLRHSELERVRAVVRTLAVQSRPFSASRIQAGFRLSVHQLPDRTLEIWLNDLRKMLKACHQAELARKLTASAVEIEMTAGTKGPVTEVSTSELAPKAVSAEGGTNRPVELSGWDEIPPAPQTVKHHVELFRWVRRQGGRVQRRYLRVVSAAISRVWPAKASLPESKDLAGILRQMLSKEDIKSGLLIGAAHGEINTEAFVAGMGENPNKPLTVCLSFSAATFRKIQKRMVKNSKVHCRFIPSGCPWVNTGEEHFDVIVIAGSELPEAFQLFGPLKAKFVVLDDINAAHIFRLGQSLLVNHNYRLSFQNPASRGGYAIFSRLDDPRT